MKKGTHIVCMILTLLLAVACGLMMPHINVNSDMTKYLPDDSQMKQGIEIISKEFSDQQLSNADVKVMMQGLNSTQREAIANELALRDNVYGVTTAVSKDSVYTKYDLLVPPSIDQKAFGAGIKAQYGKDVIVETSQDGATPPLSALVIAGAIILIILLFMAQSWIEPVLYLFAIGVAVVLNIGTNALLPSVSITTNYIVAILQLVLSLDYAIVLSNRYRQEMSPDCTPTESVNRAIKKANPAILSSAMTTIVGLMMLAFMRVKIGLDLGVVLAKGVVCSMITTFTLLPALLMLCNKAILRSHKQTFILPTDRLAWFATHHKRPLAVTCIVLFGVAFYFSRQTDIYFCTNGESEIQKVFPKTNTIVTIYNTQEEMSVIPVADSIKQDPHVQAVISYPTLLKQQYTAEGLVQYIYQMSLDMADYMPAVDLAPLTPEMMRTVYYMRTHEADTLHVGFPELMQFVQTNCMNNPLFSHVINDDVREQMALLDALMVSGEEALEQEKETQVVETPKEKVEIKKAEPVVTQESVQKPVVTAENKPAHTTKSDIDVTEFLPRLYAAQPNEITYGLLTLTNTELMHERMTARQMSDHVGSTVSQTKMVYDLSDYGRKMTPYQYVHFLTDDLFQRPALSKMVSDEQKNELVRRVQLMDAVNDHTTIPASELSSLLTQLGIENMTKERVMSIAGKRLIPAIQQPIIAEKVPTIDTTAVTSITLPTRPQQVKKHKTKAELQAERFEKLMYGGDKYTAVEMTKHFNYLGQDIDTTTVNLLYCYYGSHIHYRDSLTMSPEQLLAYTADTLIKLDIVAELLDTSTIQMIGNVQTQLGEAMAMLCHENHSLMVIMSDLPDESPETYAFVDRMYALTASTLQSPCYLVGESVMYSELKNGFSREMTIITILTVLAIFLIVAITFRSVVVPTILVIVVMTAVYVNVIVSGLASGQMLYLAYLIVQSILMGATIDYGILYANYYKEKRRTMDKYEAAREAYHGSIPTIMTSGLIMVLGPGVMALLVDDVTISAIVGCISVGAAVAILLILVVLPGVLVVADKWVTSKKIREKENNKGGSQKSNKE